MKKMNWLLVTGLLGTLPAVALGASATLSWTPPTTNEDASPLTDLAGFRVYYDLVSRGALNQYDNDFVPGDTTPNASYISVPVGTNNAGLPAAAQQGIPSCTLFYATVTARDFSSNESAAATEISGVVAETPENIVIISEASGELNISWDGIRAADGGGSVDSYNIFYGTGGSYTGGTGATEGDSPINVVDATDSPVFLLTGLDPGIEYTIRIEATCSDVGAIARLSSSVNVTPDGSNAPVGSDSASPDSGPGADGAPPADGDSATPPGGDSANPPAGDSVSAGSDSAQPGADSGGSTNNPNASANDVSGNLELGCACSTQHSSPFFTWSLVLAFGWFARRKRS